MKNIIWKGLEQESMEYCRIWQNTGISVKSTVVGFHEAVPFVVEYDIDLTAGWGVRSFRVRSNLGHIDQTIFMETDGLGSWYHDGKKMDHLQGCLDIDISITPMTNSLPLRRLKIGFGETHYTDVVYIDMPSCQIGKERQEYTCIDRNLYRFTNNDGSFSADIRTCDEGIVQHYPGLFHRVPDQP